MLSDNNYCFLMKASVWEYLLVHELHLTSRPFLELGLPDSTGRETGKLITEWIKLIYKIIQMEKKTLKD